MRWRLLKVREATLDLLGQRPAQRDDLCAIAELADRLADDRLRAYAAYRQSVLAMRTADWPACEAHARRGAPHAAAKRRQEPRGSHGNPCLYRASAAILLPVAAGTKLGKSFPASTLPREAVFPADFSAIVWNLEHLKACEPDEVLLVRAFDQS